MLNSTHLLLDNEDDVAGNNARCFVRLAVERDLLAVAHTLRDVNLQYLALRNHLAIKAPGLSQQAARIMVTKIFRLNRRCTPTASSPG